MPINLTKKQVNTLLQNTTDILKDYLNETHAQERKVTDFHNPEELRKLFDLSVSEEGLVDEDGVDFERLSGIIEEILKYSVNTQHPRFFNQLYAGADIFGIVGERLTAVLNTNMATYEIASLFTLMEEHVLEKVAEKVGYDEFEGLMLPGGSMSNLYAMHLARYRMAPENKEEGLYRQKPFVIFTSDQSHYSIKKSAILMGLGKNNIISIESDDDGKMLLNDLKKKVDQARENKQNPMMINATAGTTVLGAYDNLEELGKFAQQENIWLHVDATRGGSVIMHPILQEKIQGIKRADSFARNSHKMLGAPIQTSIFMSRYPGLAQKANSADAEYIFNDDKGYGTDYDTGDKYIQCSRRVDILKFWLQWKARGEQGLAKRVEKAFDNANYLAKKVEEHDQLFLLQQPTCTNVCFWFIPEKMLDTVNNIEDIQENFDYFHKLTSSIKDKMIQRSEMLTTYTPLPSKNLPNFFRMVFMNPRVTKEDVDFVVEHIVELGREVS